MSNRTFKITVGVLVLMMLFFIGKIGNSPEAQVQRAQQQQVLAQQIEPSREQLINRVTRLYNRTVFICDYLAQFSYLVPHEQLPATCAQMRTVGSEAIASMKTAKDLTLLSRAVDRLEIEIAVPLRDMEASYATVRQIMGGRS